MDLTEKVASRFRDGYSCSQSVFSVLAERWNVDPELSLRIAAGFGGGLARSAQICGCVTGAIMAIGLAQRSVSPEANKSEREKTYEASQRFMRTFAERNGSLICHDLIGCDLSTPAGLAEAREKGLFQAKCVKLLQDAVEIVAGMQAP
jgi:C_GCAxxG_C_C family probable redox protein